MNLMEELIYNTKDYIELSDLIQELEKHNEGEENDYYPVITFLISHDFANKIAFYDTTYFRADKLDKSANKAFEQWLQNAYEYLLENPECTFQVLSNGIQDKIAFPIMAVNRHELEALPFMKGKFIDYSYIKCEIPVFENGKEPVPPIKAPVTHDFLPNPPPYEQLLAENQKLIMEINRLLNERSINVAPSQTEQEESNLIEGGKELKHNSQTGVAKLIYTLLSELDYDITATKGKTNDLIVNASQLLGVPVSENFVAKWLELAKQAKNDK